MNFPLPDIDKTEYKVIMSKERSTQIVNPGGGGGGGSHTKVWEY